MNTFKVWADKVEDDPLLISAPSMPIALDMSAIRYGYVDYADMAQTKKWGEDEGLNIVCCDEDEA